MKNMVDLELTPELATITFSNGDEGNLLTGADLTDLEESIKTVQHADTPILLIRQAGRDFCAGRAAGPTTVADRETLSSVLRRLREITAVTISVASGACTGFGVGLFALADISLATPTAWFQFPEVAKGHAPALVTSWLFDYVPRKQALYWIMTGARISAAEAIAAGLASELVSEPDAPHRIAGLLSQLSELDSAALRECRTLAEIMGGGPLDRRSQESIAVKWLTAARSEKTRP
jgi:enoyl-CoA hydratase/carnithine racemase